MHISATALSNVTSKKKSRIHFFVISLKRNLISIIFVCFTICLVFFSKSSLSASKEGLKLWANNVVPSLFPFFIATNLLKHTNIISKTSNACNKFMRPIFNVPGQGAYAFILGLISGYPVGAQIVTDLKSSNLCTKDEAERMLCFTNNSGPLFIIGTVGITLLSNSSIGILLLITHILAALTVGIILGIISRININNKITRNNFENKNYTYNYNKSDKNKLCTFSNLGEILSEAIWDASKTIIMIGGFVVIFSILISILKNSNILNIFSNIISPLLNIFKLDSSFTNGILAGILELTNGILAISNIANKSIWINIIIISFLLGFGGLSVMLQVLSIVSKSNLSIKKYILGKFLQGIFAAFYTYILLNTIPIFFLNL